MSIIWSFRFAFRLSHWPIRFCVSSKSQWHATAPKSVALEKPRGNCYAVSVSFAVIFNGKGAVMDAKYTTQSCRTRCGAVESAALCNGSNPESCRHFSCVFDCHLRLLYAYGSVSHFWEGENWRRCIMSAFGLGSQCRCSVAIPCLLFQRSRVCTVMVIFCV